MASQPLEKGVLTETITMYVLIGLYAVFMTVLGPVLLLVVGEYSLPLSRGGVFAAWQNIGGFFGIVLSGLVIDRFSKRLAVFVSFFLFSLMSASLFFSGSLAGTLAVFAVAGLTARIADVTLNAGISEIHVRNKGFYLGLLHCSYAVGAFLGPIYAGYMVERFASWRVPFLVVGLVGVAMAVAYGVLVRRGMRVVAGAAMLEPPEPVRALCTRRMAYAAAGMLFYSGHQSGLSNWLPAYLGAELGLDEMQAGLGVSAFWVGLILGRFGCSFLTRRIGERTLLLYGNALGGVLLLAGILSGSATPVFAGTFCAGLFSGAAAPMMLTLAYSWHPRSQGRVTTILFLAITLGGVFVPWFMGVIEGWSGLSAAMLFNAAALLMTAVLVLPIPGQAPFRADE